MRRNRVLWLLFVFAILAVGFYLWGSSSTPPGQPPLVFLKAANVSQFQQSFDSAASTMRIVLLLSPT